MTKHNDLHKQATIYKTTVDGIPGCMHFITAVHTQIPGKNNLDSGYGSTLGGTRIVFLDRVAGDGLEGKIKSTEKLVRGLARDMSYKWLILRYMLAHSPTTESSEIQASSMGGGKSLIVFEDQRSYENMSATQRTKLFELYGKHIESLKGKHITAVDMNTTTKDMDIVAKETNHVVCQSEVLGGTGNPSPTTAFGVYYAIIKMLQLSKIKPTQAGYAIQGIGAVGSVILAELLKNQTQAKIWIADTDTAKVNAYKEKYKLYQNLHFVGPKEIYKVPADIFIPCAQAEILDGDALGKISPKLICGAANDIYKLTDVGSPDQKLVTEYYKAGYNIAPAPAVNLGGILHVAIKGFAKIYDGKVRTDERANELVRNTSRLIEEIYTTSVKEDKPMEDVFDKLVEKSFAELNS